MLALDQWEKRLAPYFTPSLRMLGVIELKREELDDIVAGVRGTIARLGLPQATEILKKRRPHVFLSLLTSFAAYNDTRDYWGELALAVGVSHRNRLFASDWHSFYLEQVQALGLRSFKEDNPTHPYITTIRFHAGIPVYSLPDLFNRLVLPSVRRGELNDLNAQQALAVLLDNPYNIDAPVINFLRNSGRLGEDFFESCRKLARHYERTGELLEAEDLELPERVVQVFEDLVQADGRKTSRRFRKPTPLFTPYASGAHLVIRLPAQELPLTLADGRLEWRAEIPEKGLALCQTASTRLKHGSLILEEDFWPMDLSPRRLNLALVYHHEDKQETLVQWPFAILPAAPRPPLLAVNAEDVMLRPGATLSAEETLLVFPCDSSVHIEGPARLVETCAPLSGAWQDWQAQVWDLSKAWSVSVERSGAMVGSALPIAGRLPAPQLEGAIPEGCSSPGGDLLFAGAAPRLRLPASSPERFKHECARWQGSLHSLRGAVYQVDEHFTLDRFSDQFTWQAGWAVLPLASLLGSEPAGAFRLVIQPPSASPVELRFQIWPRLEVAGLPRYLLPSLDGDEAVEFKLCLPARCAFDACTSRGSVLVELEESSAKSTVWKIQAGPGATNIEVDLALPEGAAKGPKISLTIPLPRLRWALPLNETASGSEPAAGHLEWSDRLIRLGIDRVMESENGGLHVRMAGLAGAYRASVHLIDAATAETLMEENLRRTVFSPDWQRLSLGRFHDTLRHASGLVGLVLVFQESRESSPVRIPLATFSRQLEVTDVHLEGKGKRSWLLHWKEPRQGRNRRVLLQPAWQPWKESLEFRLPDEAQGQFLLAELELEPSAYDLHFYAALPYETPLRRIPYGALTQRVNLCDPDARLEELRQAALTALDQGQAEAALNAYFEGACICAEQNDERGRDELLAQAGKAFISVGELHLLLSLMHWLEANQVGEPFSYYFRNLLFKPELTRRIIERYRPGQPELAAYLAYLPQVKNLYIESARIIARLSLEPAVLLACLRRLLQQEDNEVPALLLNMLETARLSVDSVVELLHPKLAWAQGWAMDLPATSTSDQLLAALLLAAMSSSPGQAIPEWPAAARARLAPYIDDDQLRSRLVRALAEAGEGQVFRCFLQARATGFIDPGRVQMALTVAPRQAFFALSEAPDADTLPWINWLVERFPEAAGLVKAGSRLATPLGICTITRMIQADEKELELAALNTPGIIFHLEIGAGVLSEKLEYDPSTQRMRFPRAENALECSYCGFIHPNRKVLDQHHREYHRYTSQAIRFSLPYLQVDPKKITILPS